MPDSTAIPHFFRLYSGDTIETALARHRHYLWSQLSLKPGMHVLEIGSGYGAAAMELNHFAGVSVVGIDNNSEKIEHSSEAARLGHIQDKISFIKVDLGQLSRSFKPNTFDAVYAIESLKTAPNIRDIFEQVHSVLKPGGKLALYDWCWTDTFDPNNLDHCRLANLVEDSTNIGHRSIGGRTIQCVKAALEATDFRVLLHEDLACKERAYITPWYEHLREAIGAPRMFQWRYSNMPSQYYAELTKDAASILQQAGVVKVFTPMAMFVAQKID